MEEKQGKSIQAIRDQTLEHIARYLGEHGSGPQIVDWLKSWGVPQELIEYPNTKWRMVFDVLKHYSHSTEKKDHEMLFKIISDMLHPLMYKGDKKIAETVAEDFNKYLEYDGVVATYSGDDKKYYVYKESEVGLEMDEISQLFNEELIQQEYSELEFLRQPENREKISTLRKTYQLFMNIVEVFCENPSKPTEELNDAYIRCKELIVRTVMDLDLYASSNKVHRLSVYSLPFITLFSAEKYSKQNGEILHWDAVRPDMYATYSCIDELYRKANASDVLSKPDVQQTLNDVSLLLSKTKEENKKQTEMRQEKATPQIPIQRIEITAMPELQVRSKGDNKKKEPYITKNSDDYSYKGHYINLSKKTDYYKVFSALYAKLPNGGEVSYKDLITEIKSRLPKTQDKTDDEMKKFIQRNLTDKNNGFMRYAGIPETEDNGKPLIEVMRGSGVVFNNKTG